jgi:hypothetical protein
MDVFMLNFLLKDVPKELIVWDIIGIVNKKSLNAPKFTHW